MSQKQDERNIYAIMKAMCPPSYHHNSFVVTHALGHMMYCYTLLVPMNQIVLNQLSKEQKAIGSLVPAVCNRTSCAQVYEFPQRYCGDNREDILFSGHICIYNIYVYIYVYVYIYLYICISIYMYVFIFNNS